MTTPALQQYIISSLENLTNHLFIRPGEDSSERSYLPGAWLDRSNNFKALLVAFSKTETSDLILDKATDDEVKRINSLLLTKCNHYILNNVLGEMVQERFAEMAVPYHTKVSLAVQTKADRCLLKLDLETSENQNGSSASNTIKYPFDNCTSLAEFHSSSRTVLAETTDLFRMISGLLEGLHPQSSDK